MRRISAALASGLVLVSLAACGTSTDGGSGDPAGLGAVTVSGDFGKAPDVAWNGQVTTDKLDSTTLIEGKGDKVAQGDTVKVDIWIGNGFTQKEVYSTWKAPQGSTAVPGPQSVPLTAGLQKWLLASTVDHTVGSRVLVVAPPADAFGPSGSPQLGVGDGDDVVFVVDIKSRTVVLSGPQGDPRTPPAGTPKLVEKDGTPTGFDFTGLPKNPPATLQKAVLIKGDGAVVKSGQTVTVNYLGSVYGSKTVFDQSYSKGSPFQTAIGQHAVIDGWDKGIIGQTVGSRLVLTIPAALAYGKSGSGSTIPPNATLVFVVDILSAS